VRDNLQRLLRLVPTVLTLAICTLFTNCIDSAQPILSDAQPILGDRLRFALYALREGAAHDEMTVTFVWRNDRYALTSGRGEGFGDITIHSLQGPDLIVQSIRAGFPTEYAIARKLAQGVYLVAAIDETDADESTRHRFCGQDSGSSCRVSSRAAIVAFARATASKPHSAGGLAVLVADQ